MANSSEKIDKLTRKAVSGLPELVDRTPRLMGQCVFVGIFVINSFTNELLHFNFIQLIWTMVGIVAGLGGQIILATSSFALFYMSFIGGRRGLLNTAPSYWTKDRFARFLMGAALVEIMVQYNWGISLGDAFSPVEWRQDWRRNGVSFFIVSLGTSALGALIMGIFNQVDPSKVSMGKISMRNPFGNEHRQADGKATIGAMDFKDESSQMAQRKGDHDELISALDSKAAAWVHLTAVAVPFFGPLWDALASEPGTRRRQHALGALDWGPWAIALICLGVVASNLTGVWQLALVGPVANGLLALYEFQRARSGFACSYPSKSWPMLSIFFND